MKKECFLKHSFFISNMLVLFLPRKGQILRSTSNTAPLTCGACNTQPEGLLTMA